jgi:hypothetical protein
MMSIVTIVLDGMPYIKKHLPIFQQLNGPWRWYIAEGQAKTTACTSWCKAQPERRSIDGTSEYLDSIDDDRVTVFAAKNWPNKVTMLNTLLKLIHMPGVLMEIDADEIHTPENLEKIYSLFQHDLTLGTIRMPCRYFVGPDLVCIGRNCWSNRDTEWERAWRFQPGDYFKRHEPPLLSTIRGRLMSRDEAAAHGLTFDHFAYATEAQCAYKEKFYGYDNLVSRWKYLQSQTKFPLPLKDFFPFADGGTQVVRI